LAVGSKLPTEHELCASFGVSRTALREALRRLNARGLISIMKGSGMYVTELKINDAIQTLNLYYDLQFDRNLIEQIIEVRKIFEPEIAKLAAIRRNNDDIREMEKNLKDFIQCNPDNTQLEADIDNKFHLLIAKAAHNPIIQISMEPIYTLLPRMRNLIYANIDGEKEITVDYHSRIFEAIKTQREEDVYQTMTDHLRRTTEVYYTHFHRE
jgi:GntR family transcriptional repressor for pyruvate dehydrogenase complex